MSSFAYWERGDVESKPTDVILYRHAVTVCDVMTSYYITAHHMPVALKPDIHKKNHEFDLVTLTIKLVWDTSIKVNRCAKGGVSECNAVHWADFMM